MTDPVQDQNMIITRTPFRVSFFGGGSDYPGWFRKHGGAVLSTSVNKFCYLNLRRLPNYFNFRHRIVWSHIETVTSFEEILHPAVREGLRFLDIKDSLPLELHHMGDIPARAGMGSSSSFAVGLMHGLRSLQGLKSDKMDLAKMAIELEQEWLGDTVGVQDQLAAAHGGLNVYRFGTDGNLVVDPVNISPKIKRTFGDHLMLFFTGSSRLSSKIANEVTGNLEAKEKSVHKMVAMVDQAKSLLESGDIHSFGELLHESWMLKKSLAASIAPQQVNEIYAAARENGAIGGKLLGAGGTGFVLILAPPEKHDAIRAALPNLTETEFGFDEHGSQILNARHASFQNNIVSTMDLYQSGGRPWNEALDI